MLQKLIAVSLLLSVTLPVTAQHERELLREVDANQAQLLEAYNFVFLQEELYFASRHRIVRADMNVLLQQRDITVTPFEDVEPIGLIHETLTRPGDDVIFWRGRIDFQDDLLFRVAGVGIPAAISMFAWDLDEEGSAVSSVQNRFEFSPDWRFDEFGNLDLDRDVIASTPPPQTPEEIERHRRLQKLDKRAFFSSRAVFDVPGGSRYVLTPLRYTPRYSVIYEIAPGTVIPIVIDRSLREPDPRSESQKAAFNRYRTFVENLPKEEGKQIRGDLR